MLFFRFSKDVRRRYGGHWSARFDNVCRVSFISKTLSMEGKPVEGVIKKEDLVVIGINCDGDFYRGILPKYLLDALPVNNPQVGRKYRFQSQYEPLDKESGQPIIRITDIAPANSIFNWFC